MQPAFKSIKLQRRGFGAINSAPDRAEVTAAPCKPIMAPRSHVTAAVDLPVSLPKSGLLRKCSDWLIVCWHSGAVPAASRAQWWDCAWGSPKDSCPGLPLGAPRDYRPQMDTHYKGEITVLGFVPCKIIIPQKVKLYNYLIWQSPKIQCCLFTRPVFLISPVATTGM